jgi:ubiquinone/menaquinone biosynthesis C-methylase UbiE
MTGKMGSDAVKRVCASYREPRLARIYDPLNAVADKHSRAFYLNLAGTTPKRILDMGCGTGLLACELAMRGHKVTGVDPAVAMLDIAKSKLGAEKVRWINSDAAGFSDSSYFDLIVMAGHVFQVFLDDNEATAALTNLRAHLAEGGKLAFETRNPRRREWADWIPDKTTEQVDVIGVGRVQVYYNIASVDGELVTFETHFQFPTDDTIVTRSTLRFMEQMEVDQLMRRSGFRQFTWYGDWGRNLFSPDSPEILVIAS